MSTNGQLVFTDVDKITFKGVGNTSNAVVDTVTGKIGVGTDSPDANLHVLGNSYVSTNLELGGTLIMGTVNVEAQHSLEAVTATGNTTPLTVEFSNATTGIVTTGNVEVGKELTVTGNATVSKELTVTGNLNVTTVMSDSNVVTEYTGPHNRPLRKYPEVPMTENDNSSTSGYSVVQSYYSTNSFDTRKAWNLFNHVTSGAANGGYHALKVGYHYSQTDGTYIHTPAESLGGVNGMWLYIRLPKKISLDHVKLISRAGFPQRVPRSATFLGSNNGTNWENIFSFSDVNLIGDSSSGEHTYTYNVNSTVKYEYFGFVWEKMGVEPLNSFINMEELELYGYEEGSGSLDTTLKTVYNVPATTGTQLEVYYDGRETSSYSGSGTTVTDISPNTNNGTLNGGFDSTYKAFTFDGSSSQNITSSALGFTGDQPHTFSFWIKDNEMNHTSTYVMHIGRTTHAASQNSSIEFRSDRIRWASYANDIEYPLTGITSNTWYHITGSYVGGGATPENKSLYINGKRFDDTGYNVFSGWEATAGDALGFQSDAFVTLGSSTAIGTTHFNGSIANFRLYSKALNADQVKELYDYQKDYFLGSKSQVTLYKGHLGVGVTEPSGQLELAGDERIQEYPPRDLYQYDTNIEGHGVFCVSASVEYDFNHPAWEAFGDNATPASNESVWNTPGSLYNTTSGLYTGSTTTSGIKGEWIQMKAPYKLKISTLYLDSYLMSASGRQPRNFTLLGSNDGNVWEQMKSVVNQTTGYTMASPYSTSTGGPTHTINSTKYYSYFRIVVTATQDNTKSDTNPDGLAAIGRIKFFGTPGPTTLDKGSLSLGRSLDVPRVSRYDVDTETPRPEKLVVDFDTAVNSSPTDISGKGNHGVFYNGASYSAADKAFKFVGVDNNVQAANSSDTVRGTHGLSGTRPVHSHSVWFKQTTDANDYTWVCAAGTASGQNQTAILLSGNSSYPNRITFDNYNGWVTSTVTAELNRWYHVVATFNGGTNFNTTNCRIYVDGVDCTGPASEVHNGTATFNLQGSILALGSTHNGTRGLTGLVSNYKLYDVVLEPSEVRKLYNLGRTGRSMVISDTAVGIGRAPEAQLDVRGVIRGPGLTIQTVSSYKSDTTIFAGGSVTDISGLSVTIQPKFANSKILVSYDVNMGGKGRVFLRVKRVQGSSTSYFWSDQGSGGWTQSPGGGAATSTYAGTNTDAEVNGYPFKCLDNAGGLNPITYTVQGWSNHSVYNVTINRGFVDTSAAGHGGASYWGRCVSSITVQEVCQ